MDATDELALEQVSNRAALLLQKVTPPVITLLLHAELVHVHLLVFRLLAVPIHLYAHSVKEKTQKLLRVLLSVTAESRVHPAHAIFQVIR